MLIKGNVYVVTGGASGLGQATVDLLVKNGAKVAIFDLSEGSASKTPDSVLFCKVDVCDDTSIESAIKATVARFGAIHGLVNCAGINSPSRVLAHDGSPAPLSKFTKVVSVNLIGAYNVIRHVASHIAKQNVESAGGDTLGECRGVIINIASVAAFEGQVGQVAYSASKGALHAMTLPLARDLAKYGVRVVTVAPGVFHTPMMGTIPPKAVESLQKQIAFPKRLGHPDEFAALICSIITNDYLNGETIRIDGGIRMAAM